MKIELKEEGFDLGQQSAIAICLTHGELVLRKAVRIKPAKPLSEVTDDDRLVAISTLCEWLAEETNSG